MAPSEEECGCDGCSWSDHFPGIVCIRRSISVPYGYDQFNKGAENLHPTHYTLRTPETGCGTGSQNHRRGTKSAEEMIAEAEAEAAAKGEKLTSVDIAKIKAKAKVAAQNARNRTKKWM